MLTTKYLSPKAKAIVLIALSLVLMLFASCNPAYKVDEIPISFLPGEGSGEKAKDRAAEDGSYIVPHAKEFTGSQAHPLFVGWKLGDQFLTVGEKIEVKKPTVLVAQWGKGYFVDYYPGEGYGERPESTVVPVGGSYTLSVNEYFMAPKNMKGRLFLGWDVQIGSAKPVFMLPGDKIPALKANLKATARWSASCELRFDKGAKAATGSRPSQFVAKNWVYIAPQNTARSGFTYKNHMFTGWKVSKISDDSYVAMKKSGEPVTVFDSLLFTAQWHRLWKVSFAKGDPDAKGAQALQHARDGEPYALPLALGFSAPAKPTGRVFVGWRIDTDPQVYPAGYTIPKLTHDILLTAVWSPVVRISYKPGDASTGGVGTTSEEYPGRGSKLVLKGDMYRFLSNAWVAPQGRDFYGWKLINTKTKAVIKELIQPGEDFKLEVDVTALAVWSAKQSIRFRSGANDPSYGDKPPQGADVLRDVVLGESVVLPNPVSEDLNSQGVRYVAPGTPDGVYNKDAGGVELSREFVGWKIDGYVYPAGTPYKVHGAVVADAQWTPIHTLYFKANGGITGVNNSEIPAKEYKGTPDAKVLDGAVFSFPDCGWYVPTKSMTKFMYWIVDGEAYYPASDTDPAHTNKSIEPHHDMDIEAYWRTMFRIEYRYNNAFFNFETNGEQKEEKDIHGDPNDLVATGIVWQGDPVPQPRKAPYYWYYVFDGWYPLADPETKFDFSQKVSSDLILVARWKKVVPQTKAELEQWIDKAMADPNWTKYNELNFIDTKDITDFSDLFNTPARSSFNGLLNEWVVDKVTNMDRTFKGAIAFNQPLSHWKVDNVTSMEGMFEGATSFNQGLADWKTAQVKNMSRMFKGCVALEGLDLEGWNLRAIEDISYMFDGCAKLQMNGFSIWQAKMFKLKDASFMFRNCKDLRRIRLWTITDNLEKAESMFEGCSNLMIIDGGLGSWSFNMLKSLKNMFKNCEKLGNLGIQYGRGFKPAAYGRTPDLSGMFENCVVLQENLSSWDLSHLSADLKKDFAKGATYWPVYMQPRGL